jgi:hypothetical protein
MPSGVYKRKSPLERLLASVDVGAEDGCWEWTAGKSDAGYGQIKIDGRMKGAHRLSYELHCGPIPNGVQILHRCDNPGCVRPQHLFLGTHAENMADKAAKGRQTRGSTNGWAKLTEKEVTAIRAARGRSKLDLAGQFGVSRRQISNILAGKLWKHIACAGEISSTKR